MSCPSIILTILNTYEQQKLFFIYEDFQIKLLKVMNKVRMVNPVKLRRRQVNVVDFSFSRDVMTAILNRKNVIG